MSEVRHVILTKNTYSTTDLSHILAAYIGHAPNRQKLHGWFHAARAHGYFPNARQEQAHVANSPWVLPRVDVEAYLQAMYPQGVLPHLIDDADVTF